VTSASDARRDCIFAITSDSVVRSLRLTEEQRVMDERDESAKDHPSQTGNDAH
jgi:hypothetical protein